MNKLSIKLSLLFVGIALISVDILAVWVNQAVSINFASYCTRNGQACTMDDQSCNCTTPGVIAVSKAGEAERIFMEDSQRSLIIAAIVSVLVALGLGVLVGSLITAVATAWILIRLGLAKP